MSVNTRTLHIFHNPRVTKRMRSAV